MRDLPRPGLEPVSPALAGRFFTMELPGKHPPLQYSRLENSMDRGTGWDSLEKTLMLGKTEGQRRRGWQKLR